MFSFDRLLVLLVIAFSWDCQALDGFGYELILEKIEGLEEKLDKLQNATLVKNAEDRQRETSEQNRLIQLQNQIIQMEERQRETYEQNRKILQIINKIYQHTVSTSSCSDVGQSGRYTLNVKNRSLDVYCEQALYDGGWIVIQNRFNGSVDFYRNWTEYQNGFGSLDGEFWLGLQNIHWLTSSRNTTELLVHLEANDGTLVYARYQKFAIGSENEKYKLKTLETYSGTAGDSLERSIGQKFSTFEQDNDSWNGLNCAEVFHGAWWYEGCSDSNLNGRYQNSSDNSMWWMSFRHYEGMKNSKMMIK